VHAAGITPWKHLVAASQRRVRLENERLVCLLNRSAALLDPLADPLEEDFGAHRWLCGEREESYSDWLAWILSRLQISSRILAVFGDDVTHEGWGQERARIGREYPVEAGHDGHAGRVDIRIEVPGTAVIWIELKQTSVEAADVEKNAGYRRSQDAQHEPIKRRILVATSAGGRDYHGFEFRSWSVVCAGLRAAAVELKRDKAVTMAAMTLAFVGAVEQNILGYPGKLRQRVTRGALISSGVEIADHLESWLSRVEGSEPHE
jgi:hypothetical protein